MRELAKNIVQSVASAGPFAVLHRARRRGQDVILAYHDIAPDGLPPRGDRSLHLPRSQFARQLDLLARRYDITSLDELVAGPGSGRPRLAITFDDAYAGAVTLGIEELRSRSLPATLFVAPGILGGMTPWWDQVGSAMPGGLSDEVRHLALHELAGSNEAILEWARRQGISVGPDADFRIATLGELESACRYDGLTLGAHSWSHPDLARIPADQLRRELTDPIRWIEERFPRAKRWLAYPYGSYSPVVEEAAAAAGYDRAFRILEPAWTRGAPSERHRTPRLNVPAGISPAGLALRLIRLPAARS